MPNFWNDGLSVEEGKFSLLAFCLLIGFIVFLWLCIKNNSVDALLNLLFALIAGITGINIAQRFTNNKG